MCPVTGYENSLSTTSLASAAANRYFASMEMIAFDTHDFVKRLTGAGMPEAQAEILAGEQSRLIRERLATKRDIRELEVVVRELDAARRQDIKELDAARERDKNELKRDIKELDAARERDKNELKRDLRELQQQLAIKCGGMFLVGFGALAAFIRLLL